MPVTSAISMRPDIRSLRSIGVQRKLPCQRTSDDEHSVCRSTGVLPATGVDGHATYRIGLVAARQQSGHDTLNAEAAHPLSME
jgi:hypothetical protein